MTYKEFKKKWLGKKIDFDGAYGSQCVDAYRMYCKELGFEQSPPIKGAKDLWDTYRKDDFDRIENTPAGVPETGDVIIWGQQVGEFGHVAIFDSGDVNKFISLDQNWPVDGGTGVLHEQSHNYKGVIGWLRPKGENMDALQVCLKDREMFWNRWEEEKKKVEVLQKELTDSKVLLENTKAKLDKLTSENRELVDGQARWQTELATANRQITTQNKEIDKLGEQVVKLTEEKNNNWNLYKTCRIEVNNLKEEIVVEDKPTKDLIEELIKRLKARVGSLFKKAEQG